MRSSGIGKERDVWKGVAAGAIAGLAGSIAMEAFHAAVSGTGRTGAYEPQSNKPVAPGEDATMEAADRASQAVTGESLNRSEKKVAGPLMHYAFGVISGACYGALRETAPAAGLTRGGRYGLAVWLSADQLALPLTGLSPWPLPTSPRRTNAQLLLAHIVYGVATDLTWRTARQMLDRRG